MKRCLLDGGGVGGVGGGGQNEEEGEEEAGEIKRAEPDTESLLCQFKINESPFYRCSACKSGKQLTTTTTNLSKEFENFRSTN